MSDNNNKDLMDKNKKLVDKNRRMTKALVMAKQRQRYGQKHLKQIQELVETKGVDSIEDIKSCLKNYFSTQNSETHG